MCNVTGRAGTTWNVSHGYGIAVDAGGNAYVTGSTNSSEAT